MTDDRHRRRSDEKRTNMSLSESLLFEEINSPGKSKSYHIEYLSVRSVSLKFLHKDLIYCSPTPFIHAALVSLALSAATQRLRRLLNIGYFSAAGGLLRSHLDLYGVFRNEREEHKNIVSVVHLEYSHCTPITYIFFHLLSILKMRRTFPPSLPPNYVAKINTFLSRSILKHSIYITDYSFSYAAILYSTHLFLPQLKRFSLVFFSFLFPLACWTDYSNVGFKILLSRTILLYCTHYFHKFNYKW